MIFLKLGNGKRVKVDIFQYKIFEGVDPYLSVYICIEGNNLKLGCNCLSSKSYNEFGVNLHASCAQVENSLSRRDDSRVIWEKISWERYNKICVEFPIFIFPPLFYTVELQRTQEEYISVFHNYEKWDNNLWNSAFSLSPSDTLNSDATNLTELTMLVPGEGIQDVRWSLFDTFDSFFKEYELTFKDYRSIKCTSKYHSFSTHEMLLEILNGPDNINKYKQQVRLFFSRICSFCAQHLLQPLDDTIPSWTATPVAHTDLYHTKET